MLVVGRARPQGIIQQNKRTRCKYSQSTDLDYATKTIRQQKGHALIRYAAGTQESPDRMPKPDADAMPAQAFVIQKGDS